MRTHLHRFYPIAALALLAGATIWLERISAPTESRTPIAERGKADFSADNTRLVSYSPQGRQRYELLADHIVHYPHTDITELTQPRLRHNAADSVLYLTANSGEAYRNGDEVLLRGDVRGRRSTPGQADSTFRSESLTVWPDDHRAETKDPVVLTRGTTVIHAQGMRADNLFGTLHLPGRVNATMPRSGRNPP
ncbi:LPS export ABC transporter periplasmic protein LptC [Pseudothauera nasutitermitis]|uniref:LPS export ABC transporter periplasmic protein LptC n=1 Tax=Pseudothauera nasutitermitis TaxID=2565930 RepID=A0A4S4AUV1_9RHOO|nr:LPS export ABC transporter periplasmic protein LptC [Pseudothauera nasutitermitis]THF63767.1 LPS export ABC transporter periplasmic protein LptC [Pseudothauera nasutitermitis]